MIKVEFSKKNVMDNPLPDYISKGYAIIDKNYLNQKPMFMLVWVVDIFGSHAIENAIGPSGLLYAIERP